jgi:hypothetical protein
MWVLGSPLANSSHHEPLARLPQSFYSAGNQESYNQVPELTGW